MKIRVTPRFYLLLLIIALVFVYAFRGSLFGNSEITVVMSGTASDVRTVKCVIVRDETVVSETQVTRIDYVAKERTLVREGETVASVYSLEYSTKLINDLNTTRKNIQAYHKILLGNELDGQLEVLNQEVKQKALELKGLISGSSKGDIMELVDELEEAMEARRAYMNANQRSDTKLMKYYNDETQKQNAITSWQITKTAPMTGLVSFYLDGYESTLNATTVNDLDISGVKGILNGEKPETDSSRKSVTDVFRVMDQNHWYIMLLSEDNQWNPGLDTEYSFIVTGFEDTVYTGTVIKVAKDGENVLATVEVTQPIGSLLYTRTGSVSIGANMSGLLVSKKAIDTVSGQTGVWVYDVPGGTFVPVEVLTYRDDGTALFTPLVDGVISAGSQVLIK